MPGEDINNLVAKALVAEATKRFVDMEHIMEDYISVKKRKFDETDRLLLSVSIKNQIDKLLAAKRQLVATIDTMREEGDSLLRITRLYMGEIDKELRSLCSRSINLLDNFILTDDCLAQEQRAGFLKLKGDYFRYLAGIETGTDRVDASEAALKMYVQAYDIATASLDATNVTRLAIALNMSVFYHDVIYDADRGCKLAKTAFDDAVAEIDNVTEIQKKKTMLVLQLIRDNLNEWITRAQEVDCRTTYERAQLDDCQQ